MLNFAQRHKKLERNITLLASFAFVAVVIGGVFQPRRAISAHDHRRQADPCQRARLTVVARTKEAAQFWTAQFIAA